MKTPESPPPARRYTSPTGRIVIPVLLVVLLIVVLGRPILVSGLNLGDDEPTPEPTSDDKGRDRDRAGVTRLASPYPKVCLSNEAAPGLGLIAAADEGSVSARTPGGLQAYALRANPPIGWSPSGEFLATAGADLWTAQGNHIGIAFSHPVQSWAWSPVADCIVGIEHNHLVVVRPHQRAEFLLRDLRVNTFAFSPDGTRLAFAVEGGNETGIWLADLSSGDVRRIQSSTGWTLQAWSRTERPLLVRFVEEGAAGSKSLGFPSSDEVAYCSNDVITIDDGQLAEFGVSGTPEYVAEDRRFVYRAVACDPNGQLLITVRQPREGAATQLVVLRRTGEVIEELGLDADIEDLPMWGPSGTGVVFVGTTTGEGAAGPLVWFIPEGGSSRPTGLRVGKLGDDLDARLDWSATAPLGHPTG